MTQQEHDREQEMGDILTFYSTGLRWMPAILSNIDLSSDSKGSGDHVLILTLISLLVLILLLAPAPITPTTPITPITPITPTSPQTLWANPRYAEG
jgi:hypothetical protein